MLSCAEVCKHAGFPVYGRLETMTGTFIITILDDVRGRLKELQHPELWCLHQRTLKMMLAIIEKVMQMLQHCSKEVYKTTGFAQNTTIYVLKGLHKTQNKSIRLARPHRTTVVPTVTKRMLYMQRTWPNDCLHLMAYNASCAVIIRISTPQWATMTRLMRTQYCTLVRNSFMT